MFSFDYPVTYSQRKRPVAVNPWAYPYEEELLRQQRLQQQRKIEEERRRVLAEQKRKKAEMVQKRMEENARWKQDQSTGRKKTIPITVVNWNDDDLYDATEEDVHRRHRSHSPPQSPKQVVIQAAPNLFDGHHRREAPMRSVVHQKRNTSLPPEEEQNEECMKEQLGAENPQPIQQKTPDQEPPAEELASDAMSISEETDQQELGDNSQTLEDANITETEMEIEKEKEKETAELSAATLIQSFYRAAYVRRNLVPAMKKLKTLLDSIHKTSESFRHRILTKIDDGNQDQANKLLLAYDEELLKLQLSVDSVATPKLYMGLRERRKHITRVIEHYTREVESLKRLSKETLAHL